MPGAPASTHMRKAPSTLRTPPPRELRSVATLFTLTERRVIVVRRPMLSEVFLHHIHDFLRPSANLVLPFAFEHHAQQRLGARVAHEEPALPGDARLDARDGGGHGRDALP